MIIKSAAEVMADREADQESTLPPVVDELAHYVRGCWEVAKRHKLHVHDRMVDCLQRKNGEYDAAKLADIEKQGGSAVYMLITGMKCVAAKAWLADLYAPTGDRAWELSPTPSPDLPPNLKKTLIETAVQGAMQMGVAPQKVTELVAKHADRLREELMAEAEARAERMAVHIEDVLAEGGWREQFSQFLDDLATFPAAVMKGPIYRERRKLRWVDMQGKYVPRMGKRLVKEVRRVSPFDSFPQPGITQPDEGWHIERMRLQRDELSAMRGAPGYHSESIAKALLQYSTGGLTEWLWNDSERLRLESGSGGHIPTARELETIDALEFTGKLSGHRLVDFGMDPESIPDLHHEYPVSVIVIGNYTVRAMINPDPSGKSDYYKACWIDVPGSFWGKALPETISDCQDICNASARALVNNLAMASGPQVSVDMGMAAPDQDYTEVFPWKVWYYNSSGLPPSTRQPVSFFQPSANTEALMSIYERFSKFADATSGLPAYSYGSDQGAGAAKTASGLSMLMNSAAKTIKGVVRSIDVNVIEPLIAKLYVHAMLDPEVPDDCKGDLNAKSRGSDALIHKEQQQQKLLQMLQTTLNPIDSEIIGAEGRREMLEQTFASIETTRPIVPSRDKLAQKQRVKQQNAMGPQQQQAGTGAGAPGDTQAPKG